MICWCFSKCLHAELRFCFVFCPRLINIPVPSSFPRPCWRRWPPNTSRSTRARCCRPSGRATTSIWPARTSSTRRQLKPHSPRCLTSSSPAWRTRLWVAPQTCQSKYTPARGLDLTSSFFLIDTSSSFSSSSISSFRTLAYKSQDQLVYGVQKAWPSGKEREGLPWVCLIWIILLFFFPLVCICFISLSLPFSPCLSVSDVCLLCLNLFIFLPAGFSFFFSVVWYLKCTDIWSVPLGCVCVWFRLHVDDEWVAMC